MAEEQEAVEEVSRTEELGAIFDQANAEDAVTEVVEESVAPSAEEAALEVAEETGEQPRDEQGKFTSKEEAPAAEPAEAAPEQVSEPLAAPMDLSEELAAHWAGLDPSLQTTIIDQITSLNQSASEATNRLQAFDPIAQAIAPMRPTLQMQGMTDAQYVQALVAADHLLRTQPQQALQWISQQYGIPLGQGVDEGFEQDETSAALAPVYQEVQQLRSTIANMQNQSQQQVFTAAQTEMDTFAASHPHFETVRSTMGALMQGGVAQDLQSAYDMAVNANPATRAAVQADSLKRAEEKRTAEVVERAEKAEKIANANLTTEGTSTGGQPTQFANRQEELGHTYDQIQGAA